jgi:hypothetical protein
MCLSIYVGTCICSLVIMRPIANGAESVKSHFNNFYQTLTATAPEVQKGINKGAFDALLLVQIWEGST